MRKKIALNFRGRRNAKFEEGDYYVYVTDKKFLRLSKTTTTIPPFFNGLCLKMFGGM